MKNLCVIALFSLCFLNIKCQTSIFKIDDNELKNEVKNLEIINHQNNYDSDGNLLVKVSDFSENEGKILEFRIDIGGGHT